MVLAGVVPMNDTVSMGGEGLIVGTSASADPTSNDVALISVSGRGPMLDVGMVSVEYGGTSARRYNEVTELK